MRSCVFAHFVAAAAADAGTFMEFHIPNASDVMSLGRASADREITVSGCPAGNFGLCQIDAKLAALEERVIAIEAGPPAPTPQPTPPPFAFPSPTAKSCAEYGEIAEGIRTVVGGHQVLCRRGGWTLVAEVTSSGSNWHFGDSHGDAGDRTSSWSVTNTFGTLGTLEPDFDYKSPLFNTLPKHEIMITYNRQEILRTGACRVGESMLQTFNNLNFNSHPGLSCDGGWKRCIDYSHTCSVAWYDNVSGDESIVTDRAIHSLYLKYGERDGAEDRNKDRVMISTNGRGTTSNMLDYCQGLGAFVSFSGREHSVNVGKRNDGAVSPGGGHNYGLWVRAPVVNYSPQKDCAAYGRPGTFVTTTDTIITCRQEAGKIWTLAGVITSGGTQWQYNDANGDNGQDSSAWQSSTTFGSPYGTETDYKGLAWTSLPKDEIMITFNDEVRGEQHPILRTGSCHAGLTMQQTFKGLQFNSYPGLSCDGSWKRCVDAARTCTVTWYHKYTHDEAIVTDRPIHSLYLKYGEREGAEDRNKDRVMLSTNGRGNISNMLDFPQGLGAFVDYWGSEQSANIGKRDDRVVSPGTGQSYGIWVYGQPLASITSCRSVARTGYFKHPSGQTVFCQYFQNQGWELAATVTSSGNSWHFNDQDGDAGQKSSAWMNSATFGSATNLNADYKSLAFNTMKKNNIMITYNNVPILVSNNCKRGESLRTTFNNLDFNSHQGLDCAGSWKRCVDAAHTCDVQYCNGAHRPLGEQVMVHDRTATKLYFKYGERDGAEDRNKDRVMLSTNSRGTTSNMLDYCQGLGAFVSFSGSKHSANVGKRNDGAVSPGAHHNYGIYIS